MTSKALLEKLDKALQLDPEKVTARQWEAFRKYRLLGLGFGETCGRCGGTGRYSWNALDGDRCYGCGGPGEVMPKITAALIAKVEAAVARGDLEAYFERNRKAARRKKATDIVMRAWTATGISPMYDWRKAADGISPHKEISAINRPMANAYEKVQKVQFKVARNEATDDDLDAAIDEALAIIEEEAKKLEAYR